jgi:hypothetical protein
MLVETNNVSSELLLDDYDSFIQKSVEKKPHKKLTNLNHSSNLMNVKIQTKSD